MEKELNNRREWCIWCGKEGNSKSMYQTKIKKYEGMAGFKQDVYHYACDNNRGCVTNNTEYPQ